MSDDRIPTRVDGFLLEHLDDHVLLYHPGLTKTIWLNHTASMIWGLCDGQRSIRDIAQCLGEAFADEGRDVIDDVETTLRRFADEGAVGIK